MCYKDGNLLEVGNVVTHKSRKDTSLRNLAPGTINMEYSLSMLIILLRAKQHVETTLNVTQQGDIFVIGQPTRRKSGAEHRNNEYRKRSTKHCDICNRGIDSAKSLLATATEDTPPPVYQIPSRGLRRRIVILNCFQILSSPHRADFSTNILDTTEPS